VKLPQKSRGGVNSRARTREDRAGDPLDGLVNLFDLGIVLSVAFLLAALSSLDLEAAIFSSKQEVPEDTVVAKPDEDVRSIKLNQGERVVGRGEPVGTVYRLTDGRTIIVQGKDEQGTTPGASSTPSEQPDQGATGGVPADGELPGAGSTDEPTLGAPDIGTDDVP
jgi:hypothetical protein